MNITEFLFKKLLKSKKRKKKPQVSIQSYESVTDKCPKMTEVVY